MSETKAGGRGECPHCKHTFNNVAFHAAQMCPKRPVDPDELPDPALDHLNCDHEWEFVDDSFDHEFGTRKIVYERCKHCGKEREAQPDDSNADDDDGR